MLSIRGVDQFYDQSHTLWNVDLDVPQGQCTCLMGRNGVGKTTLLKAIMGLVPVRGGTATLGEDDFLRRPPEYRARHGIGYVPQGREIFPQLTVRENLTLGATHAPSKGRRRTEDLLGLFPVLKDMLHRRGGDLSGGQQQQLAIARALALSPKLLILDEPTEGIQPNIVHQIGDVLLRLRDEGLTILLVEQKLRFAQRAADRFVVMDRGRMVASGPMSGLDEELIAKYLVV